MRRFRRLGSGLKRLSSVAKKAVKGAVKFVKKHATVANLKKLGKLALKAASFCPLPACKLVTAGVKVFKVGQALWKNRKMLTSGNIKGFIKATGKAVVAQAMNMLPGAAGAIVNKFGGKVAGQIASKLVNTPLGQSIKGKLMAAGGKLAGAVVKKLGSKVGNMVIDKAKGFVMDKVTGLKDKLMSKVTGAVENKVRNVVNKLGAKIGVKPEDANVGGLAGAAGSAIFGGLKNLASTVRKPGSGGLVNSIKTGLKNQVTSIKNQVKDQVTGFKNTFKDAVNSVKNVGKSKFDLQAFKGKAIDSLKNAAKDLKGKALDTLKQNAVQFGKGALEDIKSGNFKNIGNRFKDGLKATGQDLINDAKVKN